MFEINEGPRSRVRRINIIGNERFRRRPPDRSEMATREHVWYNIFSSRDTYDPDRLAYDQQKLRQFYLTQGYADFRVVSAVAELTPDRRDFIITYVVEEGDRYKFGDVTVESDIRDFSADRLRARLPMHKGDWYNAKQVEDTVTQLNELAGLFGYAFADVRPNFTRDRENHDDGGHLQGRRDAARLCRADRHQRQHHHPRQGHPPRVPPRRGRSVQQRPRPPLARPHPVAGLFPGQSGDPAEAGLGARPRRPRRRGRGARDRPAAAVGRLFEPRAFPRPGRRSSSATSWAAARRCAPQINYSSYSKSVELGFTEPYLFDRNIAVGFDIFRRDSQQLQLLRQQRAPPPISRPPTGGQIRAGVPLTEALQVALRYGLNYDEISLNQALYYSDPDGAGPLGPQCDPLLAGRYLCDTIGNRLTSTAGYSIVWDTLNNRLRPTRGERLVLNQDFAGLGGDVHYVRTRISGSKYWDAFRHFIFSISAEAGYIHSFDSGAPDVDPLRLTDRFFLEARRSAASTFAASARASGALPISTTPIRPARSRT